MLRLDSWFLLYFKMVMFYLGPLQQAVVIRIQPAEILNQITFQLGGVGDMTVLPGITSRKSWKSYSYDRSHGG